MTAALLGVGGLAWFVVIAIMTQVGFSGNNRYLVLGSALVDICGAVGFGWAARELAVLAVRRRRGARERHRAHGARAGLQWAAAALLALVFLVLPNWVGNSMISIPRTHGSLVYQAHLRQGMNDLIKRFGGADKVLACGSVMTEGFQVPMVAFVARRAHHADRGAADAGRRAHPAAGELRPPTSSSRRATRARRTCCRS